MSEISRIIKNVFATPEIVEASKEQLHEIVRDLQRADPSFPMEFSEKMQKDLHEYFLRHTFSTLREHMPEKIKNWVLFHMHDYQHDTHEKGEKK
jgi:hypothetical protein